MVNWFNSGGKDLLMRVKLKYVYGDKIFILIF